MSGFSLSLNPWETGAVTGVMLLIFVLSLLIYFSVSQSEEEAEDAVEEASDTTGISFNFGTKTYAVIGAILSGLGIVFMTFKLARSKNVR